MEPCEIVQNIFTTVSNTCLFLNRKYRKKIFCAKGKKVAKRFTRAIGILPEDVGSKLVYNDYARCHVCTETFPAQPHSVLQSGFSQDFTIYWIVGLGPSATLYLQLYSHQLVFDGLE